MRAQLGRASCTVSGGFSSDREEMVGTLVLERSSRRRTNLLVNSTFLEHGRRRIVAPVWSKVKFSENGRSPLECSIPVSILSLALDLRRRWQFRAIL